MTRRCLGGEVYMGNIVAVSIEESPGLVNILRDYGKTFEGNLDLVLVMDGAKTYEEYADKAFGERANKIYFTPKSTHNFEPRSQSISGQPNISNEALIYDDSWDTFRSFYEILVWMEKQGYDQKKIFVFYATGDNSIFRPKDQNYYKKKTVLCSAAGFMEIERTHSGRVCWP